MSAFLKVKQYAIYTRAGAMQFKMAKVQDDLGNGRTQQAWIMFLDASPAKATGGTGDRAYDWEHKITLKLAPPDIGIFLLGAKHNFHMADPRNPSVERKFEIVHDPGAKSDTAGQVVKSLGFQAGSSYGYQFRFSQKTAGQEAPLSFAVSVTDEQLLCLETLMKQALTMITGFYDEGIDGV